MRVLAVDDEPIALKNLELKIKECHCICTVKTYTSPVQALEWIKNNPVDVALLDIKMRQLNGLVLAKKIKEIQPECIIIFITGYSEYAVKAFELKASGYLMKPVDIEDLQRELDYALAFRQREIFIKNKVSVRCFGNFEIFLNGKPLKFKYNRTKELLAYLVDREGALCTVSEIIGVIFEDEESHKSYFKQLRKDLIDSLNLAGCDEILIRQWGKLGVNTSKFSCDYYAFCAGKTEAVNAYRGEYMLQYSWAEFTNGMLTNKMQ